MYSPSITNWKINLIIHDEKDFVHLAFFVRWRLVGYLLTEYLRLNNCFVK